MRNIPKIRPKATEKGEPTIAERREKKAADEKRSGVHRGVAAKSMQLRQ